MDAEVVRNRLVEHVGRNLGGADRRNELLDQLGSRMV
jgi:hypothetical protein